MLFNFRLKVRANDIDYKSVPALRRDMCSFNLESVPPIGRLPLYAKVTH